MYSLVSSQSTPKAERTNPITDPKGPLVNLSRELTGCESMTSQRTQPSTPRYIDGSCIHGVLHVHNTGVGEKHSF